MNNFNKIFIINNLRILAAYGILINYYTIKCTTNYMSVVNKTEIILFFVSACIFHILYKMAFFAIITVIKIKLMVANETSTLLCANC